MFKALLGKVEYFYEHHYKLLFLVPLLVLLFCFAVIGTHYFQTGEIMSRGVSLKGGTTLSIAKSVDILSLTQKLAKEYPLADINIRSFSNGAAGAGVIIEASDIDADKLLASVEEISGPLQKSEYTVDTTGPTLGSSFFKQAIYAVIAAFILMSIVVYAYFREPLPCFYAIFCVFGDMLFAVTAFNLFGLRLTTAGVAAFLMLIGYSVDTDILLTTRVLKRKEGTVSERMATAVPTGLTMSLAALAAVVVAYYATSSEALKQIMFILGWGLIGDMIYTWLFNASLLRMYVEKKEARKKEEQNVNVA
jgi:preprotein translocase subunit SecF